jgi:arylsulfatase A-like enzyme
MFAVLLILGVWSAFVFGLLEGLTLAIAHRFPAILASKQAPPNVLWIAPALDILLFAALALVLALAIRIDKAHPEDRSLRLAVGLFAFFGVYGVVSAPGIIHRVSALLLAAGAGALTASRLGGRARELATKLRSRLLVIPATLVVLAAAVPAYAMLRERALARELPSTGSGRRNVLVLILDTVRRDAFLRAAQSRHIPRMDEVISRGTWYANAWSTSSWSLPAQASFLVGRYPHEHGADWPTLALVDSVPTLAQVLGARGYATGAFSGNSAWVTPEYLGRGFLRFEALVWTNTLRRTAYGRILARALWPFGLHYAGLGKPARQVNEELLEFVDDYRSRPFYAYVCFMDVNRALHHRQLNNMFWEDDPQPRDVERAYELGLRRVDADIGALLDALERRGILRNTVIVLASDHGESFGPSVGDHDPSGHGTSLYPEQLRVPLAIVEPADMTGPADGDTVTVPVSTRGVPATIAELVDVPFPGAGEPLPGPRSPDSTAAGTEPVFATLRYGDRDLRTVIWESWQLIVSPKAKRSELYDLDADSTAANDLSSSPAADTLEARLRAELAKRIPEDTTAGG